MMKIFFVLFLGANALAQTSYISPTRTLYEHGSEVYWGGDFFQTYKRVDENGTPEDLSADEGFIRYQAELGGYYGLTRSLEAGLGARFRFHQASLLNQLGEKEYLTNSGLQSIVSSIRYAFQPIDQLTYTLETLYRYTPYTNELQNPTDSKSNFLLGDDGHEYSIGLASTYNFQNENYLSASGGIRAPGRDLSREVYWSTEGAIVWRYFALLAGMEGAVSMNSSPYSEADRPVFNTGPSRLYNSVNRNFFGPYAGVNIALGQKWRVEFKASQVIGGTSTDLGQAFSFHLIKRVEEAKTNLVDQSFKTYDVEANITKVAANKDYVQIDKGLEHDLRKGLVMDFYEFDYLGGNILIARGTIIATKSDSSVVKITQRFQQAKSIKEGLVGRARLK